MIYVYKTEDEDIYINVMPNLWNYQFVEIDNILPNSWIKQITCIFPGLRRIFENFNQAVVLFKEIKLFIFNTFIYLNYSACLNCICDFYLWNKTFV